MPPRAPYIDYEENNRMARVAKRACIIHDYLMDAFRIKNGLGLEVGCRATPDPPCDGVKTLARLFKDKGHELPLDFFINKCAEEMRTDSPIDRKVLERMKEIYCSFAASQDLEIAPTNQYGDNQQLMARTRVSLKGSVVLKGLESICFPIPEKHHTPPKYAKAFNEDYCFVNEKEKEFIQLGPASLLDHHCDPATRNVKQFGADHKRRLIGDAIIFQPSLTRSVAAGEELCINYGDDWFGNNNRDCLCSKGHPRNTIFPSGSWRGSATAISDTPTTPRASRAKRRLTSRPTSFRDQADLQDIFASAEDEGPPVPEKKRVRRVTPPAFPSQRPTPPTSPTTRALVGFIRPVVAALRASIDVKALREDNPADISVESIEGPQIMTPHIIHVDPSVTQLGSDSPNPGSESSYYDRSLYGPSPPPCKLAGDSTEAVRRSDYGQSMYGARSDYDDPALDASDDEELDLFLYGERIQARRDEYDESSDAEPMDICSDEEREKDTTHSKRKAALLYIEV